MTILSGNSFFAGQYYFFDAERTFSSQIFVSLDKTVTLNWVSPPWRGSNKELCATYVPGAVNQAGYYDAHACHLNTDPIICEIVLV